MYHLKTEFETCYCFCYCKACIVFVLFFGERNRYVSQKSCYHSQGQALQEEWYIVIKAKRGCRLLHFLRTCIALLPFEEMTFRYSNVGFERTSEMKIGISRIIAESSWQAGHFFLFSTKVNILKLLIGIYIETHTEIPLIHLK